MIMSDAWIAMMAKSNGMIDPFLEMKSVGPHILSYGLEPMGYTMRLGQSILTPLHHDGDIVVDPKETLGSAQWYRPLTSDSFVLPSGSHVLGRSFEHFDIPKIVTGIVFGKSSYARCGVIVNVTPIEAGWRGHITLCIVNAGPHAVRIYTEEGIAQIVFIEGDEPRDLYRGNYQDTKGVTPTRLIG